MSTFQHGHGRFFKGAEGGGGGGLGEGGKGGSEGWWGKDLWGTTGWLATA